MAAATTKQEEMVIWIGLAVLLLIAVAIIVARFVLQSSEAAYRAFGDD